MATGARPRRGASRHTVRTADAADSRGVQHGTRSRRARSRVTTRSCAAATSPMTPRGRNSVTPTKIAPSAYSQTSGSAAVKYVFA